MACGFVPEDEDMPLGAIIGYADITGFTEECTSDWAQEGHGAEWKWQIENARLFKTPIPYRGRQRLFEVPEINSNNLPEVYDFPKLIRDGKVLEIPIATELFKVLKESACFPIIITEENRSLFADENLDPLPTDRVQFINAETGQKMGFEVDNLIIEDIVDEDGETIIFSDPNGNDLYLYEAAIYYLR